MRGEIEPEGGPGRGGIEPEGSPGRGEVEAEGGPGRVEIRAGGRSGKGRDPRTREVRRWGFGAGEPKAWTSFSICQCRGTFLW